jgi:hypothetical protein
MIAKQKEQTMPTINTLDATTSGAAAQTSAAGVGMPLTAASEGWHHVDQGNTAAPRQGTLDNFENRQIDVPARRRDD